MSKFIVCTDAGLSSATNRIFNSYDSEDGMRGYITTQPIKTLKAFLQKWCLSDDGWFMDGDASGKKYKISEMDDDKDKDKVFYKTRWIKEEGLVHTENGDRKEIIEQKLIVSYSIKYRNFQRRVRDGQIERAKIIVESGGTAAGSRALASGWIAGCWPPWTAGGRNGDTTGVQRGGKWFAPCERCGRIAGGAFRRAAG